VAAVASDLPASQAQKVIDLTGLYVVPGLVDIHTHLYATSGMRDAWAGDNSVLPDSFSFRTGVTTMVDAGSAGWRNFEDFRTRVIDRAKTRVFALLNIVGIGMVTDALEQNVHDMDPKATAEMAKKHKDVVVGVKTAHYQGPAWVSVARAVEAGTLADIPVMVDFGYFLPIVLTITSDGKATTRRHQHYMFPVQAPYVNKEGKLFRFFDSSQTARCQIRRRAWSAALSSERGSECATGFYPIPYRPISTPAAERSHDGHGHHHVKLLVLGVPQGSYSIDGQLAKEIKHPELGLEYWSTADIAVLNLMTGQFGYADASNGRLEGTQRLICELTS
jgi:dihydroorotase